MTPEDIADAIIANRFPALSVDAPLRANIHTMIVDGIERALAESAARRTDHDGMVVARRVARFHIGDPEWAPLIVGAYLDPDRAQRALEEAMRV